MSEAASLPVERGDAEIVTPTLDSPTSHNPIADVDVTEALTGAIETGDADSQDAC